MSGFKRQADRCDRVKKSLFLKAVGRAEGKQGLGLVRGQTVRSLLGDRSDLQKRRELIMAKVSEEK